MQNRWDSWIQGTICDHWSNTGFFFSCEIILKINKNRIFHWLVKVRPVQDAWQFKLAIPTTGIISAPLNRCPHFTSATAIKHHKSVWPSKASNSCTPTIVCERDCSNIKQKSGLKAFATFNPVAEACDLYSRVASSGVKWFRNIAQGEKGRLSHLEVS